MSIVSWAKVLLEEVAGRQPPGRALHVLQLVCCVVSFQLIFRLCDSPSFSRMMRLNWNFSSVIFLSAEFCAFIWKFKTGKMHEMRAILKKICGARYIQRAKQFSVFLFFFFLNRAYKNLRLHQHPWSGYLLYASFTFIQILWLMVEVIFNINCYE